MNFYLYMVQRFFIDCDMWNSCFVAKGNIFYFHLCWIREVLFEAFKRNDLCTFNEFQIIIITIIVCPRFIYVL